MFPGGAQADLGNEELGGLLNREFSDPGELENGEDEGASNPSKSRQVHVRWRGISVPDMFMGAIYQKYESIGGSAVGGSYSITKGPGFHVIFSAELAKLSAKDGPWQQTGDGNSIEWTTVDLSFFSVDATFAWEWPFTDTFSVLAGTGLGLGFVGGNIYTYSSSNGPFTGKEEQDIPPVLPVVNFQVSPRLQLPNDWVAQLDLGLRNVLFGGFSVGWCGCTDYSNMVVDYSSVQAQLVLFSSIPCSGTDSR